MQTAALDAMQCLEFFVALPTDEIETIAADAILRQYPSNYTVCTFGDAATHFFAIRSGYLKVATPTAEGEFVGMGVFGPGDVFGAPALLVEGPRAAQVTTVGACELILIDKPHFEQILHSCPSFARGLLTVMASRSRHLVAHHTRVVSQSVEQRLANKILRLADDSGEQTLTGVQITPELSQQDLAELVSTTRQSVNKQLRAWVAAGYLTVSRGKIVVVDCHSLPDSS